MNSRRTDKSITPSKPTEKLNNSELSNGTKGSEEFKVYISTK